MRVSGSGSAGDAELVLRLRAAGCVFAEEEAAVLRERAGRDLALLEELASRRIAGEPLEPLVGWADFGSLRLAVGPGVFVPRQRTLELAERAVAEVGARCGADRPPVFVEAFAGVAPVAASVRSALPEARVLAAETDPAARACAQQNLGARDWDAPGGGTDPGEVFHADVLDGLPEELRAGIDVIAAVPPYVPSGELELMPREARQHEPVSALTGGGDGLRWIRALIEQSPAWLRPGGCLLIELHAGQLEAAIEHARGHGLVFAGETSPSAQGLKQGTEVLPLLRLGNRE